MSSAVSRAVLGAAVAVLTVFVLACAEVPPAANQQTGTVLDAEDLQRPGFGTISFVARDGNVLRAHIYRSSQYVARSGPVWFVMHGASRNAEASALHRRAVALLERALPPGSQALADAFWELAGFLEVSGDYRTAQPLMAKALAIFETDSTRTNLSRRRASYATVLRELGRGEEAAALKR